MNEIMLNKKTLEILQYLYDYTDNDSFIQLGDIETEFGISVSEVRSHVENLKDYIFVFESDRGIQISESGINFAKTRWV